MRTGIATITLDYGRCPKWLFARMKKLGGLMAELMIEEYGSEEFLRRLSHPAWFQAFGSLLAFDWNSSGLTVVLTAALKEAFKERNLGIYVAGGKGKTSRKAPDELLLIGEKNGLDGQKLVLLSKLTAKVDNSLIQDGFQIYHHSFFVADDGSWAVVQQGMNTQISQARRYHWCSDKRELSQENLIEEPHTGIITSRRLAQVLNLTDKKSRENKLGVLKIINEEQDKEIIKALNIFARPKTSLFLPDIEFHSHPVVAEKFDLKRLRKTIAQIKNLAPKDFTQLILTEGVGPKTIRALSLASELITGAKPSFEDPARYTFAHGGKDGTPYPVDRKTYDETIKIFQKALQLSRQKKVVFLS